MLPADSSNSCFPAVKTPFPLITQKQAPYGSGCNGIFCSDSRHITAAVKFLLSSKSFYLEKVFKIFFGFFLLGKLAKFG
ncbi:MAG: hypothetical protein IAX21_02000 [Candidatus Bathyarchaeota archaeon]|nr:hypothetical protein [Candidatus Bathyarchaeum tardum]WGM90253.1 MAG: hypothetical protein NUK63_03805 [Candidatus Bathyarchaeum tardum]WNZ29668.1 MAG: hypothetical protein IAX21_02000 [Candidatus Bathyarchaeota archaeon]